MTFPQGLNFRNSSGFVADGANESFAHVDNFGSITYPQTTAQGNTVGSVITAPNSVDRNATLDRRLAGNIYTSVAGVFYRIDLPAAGTYNIRMAAGDASFGNSTQWSIMDNTTLLATVTTGSVAAGSFKDANDVTHTAANWPANNTPRALTFTTTALFIRADTASNNALAHFYIEAASAGATINCTTGNAAAAGATASIQGSVTIAATVGSASATGQTATITNSNPSVTVACAVGNAAAAGLTAAFGTFVQSDQLINNTGTLLPSTAVYWTWTPAGRTGSMVGITPVDGTGTTDANARLAPGIARVAGKLDIAVRAAAAVDDAMYTEMFA
jgi:hypothetical protein